MLSKKIAIVALFACSCSHQQTTSSGLSPTAASFTKEAAIKANSQIKLDNVGIYLDSKTNTYYASSTSKFSLKSSGDDSGKIEVSVDNERFKTYEGPLQFEGDGIHMVRYRSIGPFSEVGPIGTIKVFVDNTPPNVIAQWTGLKEEQQAKTIISPKSQLSLDAEDASSGTAKIFVKLSAAAAPEEYKEPLSFKQSGNQSVWVAAADQVGNLSSWSEIRFIVDSQGPNVTSNFGGLSKNSGKMETFVGDTAKLALSGTDDFSSLDYIEYQLGDETALKYSLPIDLPNKNMTISYRAFDKVGNAGQWKSLKIVSDKTKPTIEVAKLASFVEDKGIIYAKPGFALKIDVKDQESGISESFISHDQIHFEKLTSNKLAFNKPGVSHFVIKAIDGVGNTSYSDVTSIFIDQSVEDSYIKPKQKMIESGGSYLTTLPNSIEIIGSDNGVGIMNVEYSYDGKVFQTASGPIDLALWNTKNRKIYYRAIDKLGNMEETKSMTISIQKEASGVEIFVNTGNKASQEALSEIRKKVDSKQGQNKL